MYHIYAIFCDDTDDVYIGITKHFAQRKHLHKHMSKYSPYKLYQTIRENGGWKNWQMISLETHDIDKAEARKIEEEKRLEYGCNLNSNRCYRTEDQKKEYFKQWRKNNPDYHKIWNEINNDYQKAYREKNRDYRLQKNNEKVVCECGACITRVNKSVHERTNKHQKFLNIT